MDQNVIKLTKLAYRKNLLASLVKKNPKNIVEGMRNVTLKDVFIHLADAWNSLSPPVIERCWGNLLGDYLEDEEMLPLSILKERLIQQNSALPSATEEILQLLGNESVTQSEILKWNDDITSTVDIEHVSDEDEDIQVLFPETPKVTTSVVIENLDNIITWAATIDDINVSDILVLRRLRKKLSTFN
ncbi:hypothetical protein ABEB36_015281 [Hypothenemus hampei]|uniref:DDE-1 domain-containing protein n=1 Tax=Hypothenemus hampei TaxID=57062 RepID=A0ABD1DZR0_HYPHA